MIHYYEIVELEMKNSNQIPAQKIVSQINNFSNKTQYLLLKIC